MLIYNTGPADIYQDINAGIGRGIVTSSTTNLVITDNSGEHQINMNPAFQVTQQSPGQRLFIIDGAISLCVTRQHAPLPGTIITHTRLHNRDQMQLWWLCPALSQGLLLVRWPSGCEINYDPGTASRGGLVSIRIMLDDTSTGESISLLHQVHVVNVP